MLLLTKSNVCNMSYIYDSSTEDMLIINYHKIDDGKKLMTMKYFLYFFLLSGRHFKSRTIPRIASLMKQKVKVKQSTIPRENSSRVTNKFLKKKKKVQFVFLHSE